MKGIEFNFPAIAGATVAAVTITVLSSFFGIEGTIIGAAVASFAGGVLTALYQHFIIHGRNAAKNSIKKFQQSSPAKIAVFGLAFSVFLCAVTLGGITAVEAATGKPFSALILGKHVTGTTLGSQHAEKPAKPSPVVTFTPSPSPTLPLGGSESQSPSPSPSPGTSVTPSMLSPSPSLSGTLTISPSPS